MEIYCYGDVIMGFIPTAKLEHNDIEDQCEPPRNEEEEKGEQQEKEQDDPYNFFPEDIYDSVDQSVTYNQVVQNRPPAPIPRPQSECERSETYISRGIIHFCFIFTYIMITKLETSCFFSVFTPTRQYGNKKYCR